MKCAVCGKEFGTNNTCQYCGADKVVGLGNYSGYDVPNSGSFISHNEPNRQGDFAQAKIKKVESMVCYACGEIIPVDSRFCPHCSKELYVTCPKCGYEYSSQYPTCNKCGTNRNDYIKIQQRLAEEEKCRQEEYIEKLRCLTEKRKRQREEKRRKEEIERRKHEEWLNSPEGQAEQKRKKREETKGCLYSIGYIAIFIGTFILIPFLFCILSVILFNHELSESTKEKVNSFGYGVAIAFMVAFISFIVGYVFYRPRK